MNGSMLFLRSLRIAGTLLASALAACSSGNSSDPWPPASTVYFGPITDTPVDFTLSGTVLYEDRLQGLNTSGTYGFTGTTEYNPVRYAVVDVADENDTVLQTGATDGTGRFTITATGNGLLRLRVFSRTDESTGIRVSVNNSQGEIYAISRYFVPAAGNLDLDQNGETRIPIASMAGAYNILDLFAAGAEFFHSRNANYPPLLTAYWQPGSGDGTFFRRTDNSIHILGGSRLGVGDTDEYDDDVLLHEYGHFLETVSGNLDSFGGNHALGDNTQDLRLSWSEGWSNYISGAIKKWAREDGGLAGILSNTNGIDSYYLDTYNTGARIQWDFDADYSQATDAEDIANSYASSETGVAKILWGLTNSFGLTPIWGAYEAFPDEASRSLPGARPVSLETYWDSWLVMNTAEDPRPSFLNRRVDYSADTSEADNDFTTASPLACGEDPTHTLYAAGITDADFFTVSLIGGTRYTVETHNLLNGADTDITLFDQNLAIPSICGTTFDQPCSNDNTSGLTYPGTNSTLNINDGVTLASRLAFTAPVSGSYYIRVTPAPVPSLAAGRYGSYSIRLVCP